MIINKTPEFKKCRPKADTTAPPPAIRDISNLRLLLLTIKNDINSLSIKQEKHCLPSFVSKKKRRDELELFKTHISNNISSFDNLVKSLEFKHPLLDRTIRDYFGSKLKLLVTEYRNIQQSFLLKINFYEEYEVQEEAEYTMESKFENVIDLRQSIYELTTLLVEMKMVVKHQGYTIDRIDFFYDSTNISLEGLNKEIDKLSASYGGYKDKIMYFLILFVVILVCLTVLKIILFSHKKAL
ncbi:t-SNARE affecting a late Golgi compartment protein 2 [Nosema granulosis]|uniref:t-SNARE affecting a late Golgi compartment protein 2 n=1 Tax=Nosema granulosis TaxID=83296 RepID=A0A9P6H252_9MICR|nr:t-SNARE affecting a late Golgi compartment protein 2 [Nosema granulosis]